jgi:hypothetical protein
MLSVRHDSMLIGGDWVDADDRFEIRSPVDLSGRLDRRAYALLLSAPPA